MMREKEVAFLIHFRSREVELLADLTVVASAAAIWLWGCWTSRDRQIPAGAKEAAVAEATAEAAHCFMTPCSWRRAK